MGDDGSWGSVGTEEAPASDIRGKGGHTETELREDPESGEWFQKQSGVPHHVASGETGHAERKAQSATGSTRSVSPNARAGSKAPSVASEIKSTSAELNAASTAQTSNDPISTVGGNEDDDSWGSVGTEEAP